MNPHSTLSSVVLPAPFGPITPRMCRGGTASDTESSAVSPPNRTVTSLTSRTELPFMGNRPLPGDRERVAMNPHSGIFPLSRQALFLVVTQPQRTGYGRRGRRPAGLPRCPLWQHVTVSNLDPAPALH